MNNINCFIIPLKQDNICLCYELDSINLSYIRKLECIFTITKDAIKTIFNINVLYPIELIKDKELNAYYIKETRTGDYLSMNKDIGFNTEKDLFAFVPCEYGVIDIPKYIHFKFDVSRFMSIGSNCASYMILGNDRVRGPIDNFVLKGLMSVKSLFDKSFLKFLDEKPIITERETTIINDSKYKYEYKDFYICHNNPLEKKYKQEIRKRYNKFIEYMNDKSKLFLYSIGDYDNENTITEGLNYLQSINMLDRVIFIGIHKRNLPHWTFSKNTLNREIIDKYQLKYIDIHTLSVNEHNDTNSEFIKYIFDSITK